MAKVSVWDLKDTCLLKSSRKLPLLNQVALDIGLQPVDLFQQRIHENDQAYISSISFLQTKAQFM